jgi:putative ABC transport system permease protein
MFLLQLRITVAALRKSGWRAVLAMSCVAVGIVATMMTLALSTGAERELAAISEKLGRNLFVVNSGSLQARTAAGPGWSPSTRLKPTDATAISEQIGAIQASSAVRDGAAQVRFRGLDTGTTVRGVEPAYFGLRNLAIAAGRPFEDFDNDQRNRVAVVGSYIATRLNGGESLVGERLWINGTPYEVVGQLAEKGVSPDGTNEDDQVFVPVQTALQRLFHVDFLSSILLQTRRLEEMDDARAQVRAVLRDRHALAESEKDDFDVVSLMHTDAVKRLSAEFLAGMSRLFAAISLFIGGVGVFAVTTLNVRDRTGEIGLRMAIGARRIDIARLFIVEACLLSGAGGALGMILGTIAIVVLGTATDWSVAFDLRDLIWPVGLSVLMGLASGTFPAVRASRLPPVEALRAS